LAISPDEYRVVGHTAAANLEELLALARERELVLIAALGTAPLADGCRSAPQTSWTDRQLRAKDLHRN
jgi:hypothetical protein